MGVMIPMKRERMLTIRVTDDEHARLLERCEGKQLAVWMRRVCLGEPVARSGKLPTLAPPLLRQLAAIGNNLNQTARKVNSGQWSSGDPGSGGGRTDGHRERVAQLTAGRQGTWSAG